VLEVALRVPERLAAPARWALGELALRWGLPVRFGPAERAHVVYGGEASATPPGTLHWPCDAALYEPATPCAMRRDAAGRALWVGAHAAPQGADLVAGALRLLGLLDESGVPESERDRRGIFRTDALPGARREALDQPLVEAHAEALLEPILARHPRLADARVPRWPGGARWAIAPSHDVDAVDLGAPAEIATNLAKRLLRGSREHGALAALGLRHAGRPLENPYFTFAAWREWESRRNLRSAFYVFHRPRGTRADVNDCKSSLASFPTPWPRLREQHDQGWEFGLHPSIHCKDTPGAFAAARAWLEGRLGRPVPGLRHHYWALDWRAPVRTWREHERAGFTYDSSIAWRERAGFRAGTALPYAPFDPERGAALSLLELPCVLMDGHVLLADAQGTRRAAADAVQGGRAIAGRVRDRGGLLTINWHGETAFDRLHVAGYLEALEGILAPWLGSSEVWCATPAAVAAHWRERASRLAAASS